MKIKRKSWLWGPWREVTTTIGETIYLGRTHSAQDYDLINHELIHMKQQRDVGLFKFIFLYLFCFPVLWNPWRFKWEWQAYEQANGLTDAEIYKTLGTFYYGWMKNKK